MSSHRPIRRAVAAVLLLAPTMALAAHVGVAPGDDPYADAVIDFDPGLDPTPGYGDASTALGAPERFTGEGVFPGVVSIYNGPWLATEIVSIGQGGSLTLRFDTPVTDDPDNPYGIDLLVFSNAFFVDGGSGITSVFGEGGSVEVSADGASWTTVDGISPDGLFPTQGYLDAGPYDPEAGLEPSDFTRPVNPCLAMEDFAGLDHEQARSLYLDAGGGAGIDLAPTGLAAISYVRIVNDGADGSVEIDAVADVAPGLTGDVTRDGHVGIDDVVAVVLQWGPVGPDITADVDGDCAVGIDDLVLVILGWTGDPR